MPQLNVSNLVRGFRDECFSGQRVLFLEVSKLVSEKKLFCLNSAKKVKMCNILFVNISLKITSFFI